MRLFLRQIDVREIVESMANTVRYRVGNNLMLGLWVRNSWLEKRGQDFHKELEERWALMERIDECRITGTGLMWVSESGRDCDGVQYSGQMHSCEATLPAFNKLQDDIGEWADGPFSLYPVTEKEREESRYQSRDLTMEAHEDGHPYVVSSVRFDEDGSY